MLTASLPPVLHRFIGWVEENPAMGAVAVLTLTVALLWLVRKSIKFFMVVCLLLVAVILGSYFYYGPEKTNETIRDNAREVIDKSKSLLSEPTSEGLPESGGQ
ncbi:MAG: hypothetical protein MK209_04720 [Planctomycetes bacterium]|nr:hypothetical protein [Planctomycetota bacterium]